MNREAIVAIAFVGAFVLWASSGSAQVPCKNPQSIGCDVDPNTGRFIERGSAPRPPTNEAQPREPARAPTAPQRPMTEQDRRDMERARALDQRREAEEARFKAYVADCQTANRLGQPECLAASEWLKSEADFNGLRARMGERRWEDYRLYNKIAFGYEQDIQRLNAQIQKANAAREQWTRDFNPEQLNAALVSQAETLFAQQQYAQAVPLLRRALANANGRQFNAARMLPEALRRLQPPDVGGAYLAYRELVDRFRDDAPSKAAFGRFLIDLGRWSEAKDVVLLAGSIPEGREVTARALAGEGRYEEAEAEVTGPCACLPIRDVMPYLS